MRLRLLFCSLGLASTLPLPASAPPADPPQSAEARRCFELEAEALTYLSRLRRPEDEVSPRVLGLELLEQAIEVCSRASENAQDPELAARTAASAYLSRARQSSFRKQAREKGREILTEAIDVISGLHHDRSPALLEVLRDSAFKEWTHSPKYGARLMEQACEIALQTHGAEDPRYAEMISDFGFLYAPSRLNPDRSGVDAERAEELYREAMRIYTRQDDPAGIPGFTTLIGRFEDLFRTEDRTEEADEMQELLHELFDEEQRRAEEERRADEEREAEEAAAGSGEPGSPAPEKSSTTSRRH